MEQEAFTITGDEITTRQQRMIFMAPLAVAPLPSLWRTKTSAMMPTGWGRCQVFPPEYNKDRNVSIGSPVQKNSILVAVNGNDGKSGSLSPLY